MSTWHSPIHIISVYIVVIRIEPLTWLRLKTRDTAPLLVCIKPFFFFAVRSCSSLSAPQYGFIFPHMCTSYPVSGTVCYFECRHGFFGNGGTTEILCGNDGKWSKNESSILQCLGKRLQNICCKICFTCYIT